MEYDNVVFNVKILVETPLTRSANFLTACCKEVIMRSQTCGVFWPKDLNGVVHCPETNHRSRKRLYITNLSEIQLRKEA